MPVTGSPAAGLGSPHLRGRVCVHTRLDSKGPFRSPRAAQACGSGFLGTFRATGRDPERSTTAPERLSQPRTRAGPPTRSRRDYAFTSRAERIAATFQSGVGLSVVLATKVRDKTIPVKITPSARNALVQLETPRLPPRR